jgi:glycosyltransferase involved in cell wall biosynthesis
VKGFDIFLEATGIIHENRPDTRFLLVGDGPRLEALKAQARESGADRYVIFPGFRDDIHDLLNCLDIFVVSSYHEGIPMVVLEAMTLGTVVVSTAVGGILEIIEDGRSGVLVDGVDPRMIAESCLKLAADDTLTGEIEVAAPRRIADKFGIDAQRQKIADVYREVVN